MDLSNEEKIKELNILLVKFRLLFGNPGNTLCKKEGVNGGKAGVEYILKEKDGNVLFVINYVYFSDKVSIDYC